ncbi:hypothetical protein [Parapedobacter lycopersici]|uniref:hypothetical protein n=1 Tax=Parapedobacter lycopersici TaxID=1864939 RepID=UPI00214DDB9B|nr:hypothetical protein [Parapedobacter lycopersici]
MPWKTVVTGPSRQPCMKMPNSTIAPPQANNTMTVAPTALTVYAIARLPVPICHWLTHGASTSRYTPMTCNLQV